MLGKLHSLVLEMGQGCQMETAFQEVKEGEPFPGSVLRLINRAWIS
jgi:hypothetical protein